MKYFYILLILFSFQAIHAQEITIKKGTVIDSLSINDSIAESYSLYLPVSYTNDKKWPVVFVFDSEGRGRSAAQLFRQAAEDQGYIIAASNNIDPKQSLLDNVKGGTRLINRVFSFFPIDTNRVYTAGFSEGGRVASALPAVFKEIDGVMSIGDAWINTDLITKRNGFSFIGLAGYKDHRYSLLKETAQLLKITKSPSAVYRFEGGHEWPEGKFINNALATFTLEAMAKGIIPRDEAMVEKLYKADLETFESLRRMMQPYKAYNYLEKLESKYSLFGKKDEIRGRLKELRRTRAFKDQRREYNNVASTEYELVDRYLYFFGEDVNSSNFENLGWWSQQIKELQQLQQGKNQAEAEMAYRLEGMLSSLAENTFKDLSEKNARIDPLIFTAILKTIFDKENPQGYKDIISLSSQDGDYYTALLYLEDLLKTGYKDLEALYNIPGTLDLKLSPEYNELVKKYLGESKFYDN